MSMLAEESPITVRHEAREMNPLERNQVKSENFLFPTSHKIQSKRKTNTNIKNI